MSLTSAEVSIMRIPAGTNGVSVQISSSKNLDIKLYDDGTSTCVAGVGCSPGSYQGTFNYAGIQFYYSGDISTTPAAESVAVLGVTDRAWTIKAKGYGTATVTIQYSHGVQTAACSSPLPGCALCSDYAFCQDYETPTCDGGWVVVCTPSTTTTTSMTVTSTTMTTTTTLPKIGVVGSFSVTFVDGIDACSTATVAAVASALADACSDFTSLSFTAADVLALRVGGCSRRLAEDGATSEGRRLATTTEVSYTIAVPGVRNPNAAQALVTAIAGAGDAFASALQTLLDSYGASTSALAVSVPVLDSPGPVWEQALWDNDTAPVNTDTCEGVAAPLWRVVGRGAGTEWIVAGLGFYRDMACTQEIEVAPRQEVPRDFYNGRAFNGPPGTRRGGASAIEALAAGVAGADPPWRSGRACGDFSDVCFLGFEWFTDVARTPSPRESGAPRFTRVALSARAAVQPRCLVVNQSSVAGEYAATVVVQYRQGADAWTTLRTLSGLTGGLAHVRLPVAR